MAPGATKRKCSTPTVHAFLIGRSSSLFIAPCFGSGNELVAYGTWAVVAIYCRTSGHHMHAALVGVWDLWEPVWWWWLNRFIKWLTLYWPKPHTVSRQLMTGCMIVCYWQLRLMICFKFCSLLENIRTWHALARVNGSINRVFTYQHA